MKIGIQAALFVIAIILAYFIYDGVQNKIDFRDMAQKRSEIVQNRLQEVAVAQKKFKQEKGRYAANFPELINFVKNDSLTIIKAIGNVPDSLTEVEAVILGIVIRDTSLVPATSIFVDGFAADSLKYVPFGDGNEFKIITQVFLYKFLNDKFVHEIKQLDDNIKNADNWEETLKAYKLIVG